MHLGTWLRDCKRAQHYLASAQSTMLSCLVHLQAKSCGKPVTAADHTQTFGSSDLTSTRTTTAPRCCMRYADMPRTPEDGCCLLPGCARLRLNFCSSIGCIHACRSIVQLPHLLCCNSDRYLTTEKQPRRDNRWRLPATSPALVLPWTRLGNRDT